MLQLNQRFKNKLFFALLTSAITAVFTIFIENNLKNKK